MPTASIALLLDTKYVTGWERQAIENLLNSNRVDVTISHIIVNDSQNDKGMADNLRSFVFDFSLWKGYIAAKMVRDLAIGSPWYQESFNLHDVIHLGKVEEMYCTPQPVNGLGNELSTDAISFLEEVDVAIRFGFGILKGEALTAPKHGVVSYHHGDVREYRGRPAGFYEFLHNEEYAGVTVQRLNQELDKGDIAAFTQVPIGDVSSYKEVRNRLFASSGNLLEIAVENCVKEENIHPPETTGELYTTPSAQTMVCFIKRHFGEKLN